MNLNEAKQQAYSAAHRAASKMKEIMPLTMNQTDAAELLEMSTKLCVAANVIAESFGQAPEGKSKPAKKEKKA